MSSVSEHHTMARELKGAPLAKLIKQRVKSDVDKFKAGGISLRMATVLTSDEPSAFAYAELKQKAAAAMGITVDLIDLRDGISQSSLEATLRTLSRDPLLHGILVEFPLAPDLDSDTILSFVAPEKDIDGLTPVNLGLISAGKEDHAIAAASPQACIELAEQMGSLDGKRVAIIGRGRTVGRPLMSMLVNRNATVTVCHSRTPNLREATRGCDIVMVAIGKPKMITAEHIWPGQVVIDAGINIAGDHTIGDVDIDSVAMIASAITPVPGGVGPLTSAIIMRNLVRAAQIQMSKVKA